MAAAKKQKDKAAVIVQNDGPLFSKEQIAASERYRDHRDLVVALLNEEEKYTYETVDKLIEKYKKGQVK